MTQEEERAPGGGARGGPSAGAGADRALVERCLRAGQDKDAAFALLYERHAARVFGFLLKLTRDRSAAEDALQETFLRVYRSLDRFDRRRELSAWLLQIARYVAIDAYRVERKVKRLEEHSARERSEESRAGPAQLAESGEREAVVEATLELLSPEDRSLLLLRHYEELTFREIGEAIDCSSRTAQNRVGAAGRRFQEALRQQHPREAWGSDELGSTDPAGGAP